MIPLLGGFLVIFLMLYPRVIMAQTIQHTYTENLKRLTDQKEDQSVLDRLYKRINGRFERLGEVVNFTPKEVQAIVEGHLGEWFFQKTSGTGADAVEIRNVFLGRYEEERDIWDWEQNLIYKQKTNPRYSNEVTGDGLFDLVQNWNDIDRLLFGGNASKTNAKFGKNTAEFSVSEEPWQKGDPRQKAKSGESITKNTEKGTTVVHAKTDDSVSAHLNYLEQFLKTWIGKPVNPQVATRRLIQAENCAQNNKQVDPQPPLKMPTKKLTPPEVALVEAQKKEDFLSNFRAIESRLLHQSRCEPVTLSSLTRQKTVGTQTVQTCEFFRDHKLSRDIEAFEKTGDIYVDQLNGYRVGEALLSMDDHMQALYGGISQLQAYLKSIAGWTVVYEGTECQWQ